MDWICVCTKHNFEKNIRCRWCGVEKSKGFKNSVEIIDLGKRFENRREQTIGIEARGEKRNTYRDLNQSENIRREKESFGQNKQVTQIHGRQKFVASGRILGAKVRCRIKKIE